MLSDWKTRLWYDQKSALGNPAAAVGKAVTNNGLWWTHDRPSRSIVYFDLLISLRDGYAHSQMKHKDCVKFGYLPPHSEHPKSTFKGMMTSLLICLHEQNTDGEDFVRHGRDLFCNMKERGYNKAKLCKYFRHAPDRIDYRIENPHRIMQQKICTDGRGNLYFPWKAHSDGIPPTFYRKNMNEFSVGSHTTKRW